MQYYFLQNLAEALYFTQSKSKSLIMAHKPLHGTAPSWSSESFLTLPLLTQPHWPLCQSLNLPNTLLGCMYLRHILIGTLSPWISLCLVSSSLTGFCSPSQWNKPWSSCLILQHDLFFPSGAFNFSCFFLLFFSFALILFQHNKQ